ncbi:GNAT family N-acetyltransferase [Lunatibacter salilacus]|uniref:GNAT family N-acetyltransferase n=1 Tax=Lunatibacter salilacus TaxID=2483804 RepID=UPI00131AA181|nr:GNAT family N-acetyltransferase [Lunatibacter salilacus]
MDEIFIRRILIPGDIGRIIHLHGKLYHEEFGFGLGFEQYVAESFADFVGNFKEGLDRVWICEYQDQLAGFISLVHRDQYLGQLRYFIISPEFRGIGLGKKLTTEFMLTAREKKYQNIYLWTTTPLTKAASIYQKLGFKLVLEQESYSFGLPLIEQKFELTLTYPTSYT